MNLVSIRLPAQLNAEAFLPFLSDLGNVPSGSAVTLDFSQLHRITPGGLVALASTAWKWRSKGSSVELFGLKECPILSYLQRMDLPKVLGMELPESFFRREANGRFVPLRVIDHRVDEMGVKVADCLAPGGGDYDHPLSDLHALAWYVVTETANNVRQHSRGTGYLAAQVYGKEGVVRLALADNGKGIRQSLIDAGFAWAPSLTHAEAILKALEPKLSSKGPPTNEGVGLTLVQELARLTHSWLLIVSGSGAVQIRPGKVPVSETMNNGTNYPGTLLAWSFRQDRLGGFAEQLHQAKVNAGLLPDGVTRFKFS
jgi:ABC-type transporter Mla MlaB component